MNMKFKVGDKVVRTRPEFDYMYMEAGKVYTVTEVFGPEEDECIYVEGKPHLWDADFFELYVEPEVESSPSELEEAYARIDSLEELTTNLVNERTTLIAAVKSLKMVIADNINVLDSIELGALSIVDSTLKAVIKPELE